MKNKTPRRQHVQPGIEAKMDPAPVYERTYYHGSGKLKDKVAIITGGDSGIGRAVALHFAKEGANIAIVYLNEDTDAKQTKAIIEAQGQKCLLIKGDVADKKFCRKAVLATVKKFGKINILINNAGMQFPKKDVKTITEKQLTLTFKTNIFAYFYFVEAVLPHLKKGDSIINTTSVTAYRSSPKLIDYSSSKGAITSFTRSLATNLAHKNIRVNAVAPGAVWTPLIVATFDQKKINSFGKENAMQRAGEPAEIAPAYVFLASQDASFVTGQVIHVNGGEVVNG